MSFGSDHFRSLTSYRTLPERPCSAEAAPRVRRQAAARVVAPALDRTRLGKLSPFPGLTTCLQTRESHLTPSFSSVTPGPSHSTPALACLNSHSFFHSFFKIRVLMSTRYILGTIRQVLFIKATPELTVGDKRADSPVPCGRGGHCGLGEHWRCLREGASARVRGPGRVWT